MATFRDPKTGLTETTGDPDLIKKYEANSKWTRIGGVNVNERAEKWKDKIDLTTIKGVGDATAADLVNAGFMSIKHIADSTPAEISEKADIVLTKARKIHQGAVDHIG